MITFRVQYPDGSKGLLRISIDTPMTYVSDMRNSGEILTAEIVRVVYNPHEKG